MTSFTFLIKLFTAGIFFIGKYIVFVEIVNRKKSIEIRLTPQKMKFSIKDFFSKCGHFRSKLRVWSHLLKKSAMANFIF